MRRVELYKTAAFIVYGDFDPRNTERICLHIVIEDWNLKVFKKMLETVDEFRCHLPRFGITYMLAATNLHDKKIQKLCTMLGFDYYSQGGGFLFMRQDCYQDASS